MPEQINGKRRKNMQHQKQAFGILARTNVLKMKWMTDNEGRLAAA
jgi:hypothetical protein